MLLGERTLCLTLDLNLEEYKLDLLQIHYSFEGRAHQRLWTTWWNAQLAYGERNQAPRYQLSLKLKQSPSSGWPVVWVF